MSDTTKKLQRADELLKAVEKAGKIDYALGYLNGMADADAMRRQDEKRSA